MLEFWDAHSGKIITAIITALLTWLTTGANFRRGVKKEYKTREREFANQLIDSLNKKEHDHIKAWRDALATIPDDLSYYQGVDLYDEDEYLVGQEERALMKKSEICYEILTIAANYETKLNEVLDNVSKDYKLPPQSNKEARYRFERILSEIENTYGERAKEIREIYQYEF